jgi:hypothetical protein
MRGKPYRASNLPSSSADAGAAVPERAARLFPALGDVRVVDLPFDAGPLVESLWWHPGPCPSSTMVGQRVITIFPLALPCST